MPRVSPAVIRKTLETEEMEVGQGKPRAMPSTGKASLEPMVVEPVDRMPNQDKLDNMAYSNELIKILVHDTTNPTDEKIVEVWVNSVPQRFMRGSEQTVKRKYVENLARAKKTTYSQEKYLDHNGTEAYRNIPHTALRYPFSVIEDARPNMPDGRPWLKTILAEA
jgi:hypothetical protein